MSIGFAPHAESEVEQLRSAYKSLNDVSRNLMNVARCIKQQELRMAVDGLDSALLAERVETPWIIADERADIDDVDMA